MISEPEKTERYLYFVKEGIQKSYYLNEGKQHVMFFAYTPSFSGVIESSFSLKHRQNTILKQLLIVNFYVYHMQSTTN